MALYKTDDPRFLKDPSKGAVLNNDNAGFEAHKRLRAKRLLEKQTTEARLSALEKGMSNIEQLLLRLVAEKEKG